MASELQATGPQLNRLKVATERNHLTQAITSPSTIGLLDGNFSTDLGTTHVFGNDVLVFVGDNQNNEFKKSLEGRATERGWEKSKHQLVAVLPSPPATAEDQKAAIARLWKLAGQGLNIIVPGSLDGSDPVLFSADEPGNYVVAQQAAAGDTLNFYVAELKKLEKFLALSSVEERNAELIQMGRGAGKDFALAYNARVPDASARTSNRPPVMRQVNNNPNSVLISPARELAGSPQPAVFDPIKNEQLHEYLRGLKEKRKDFWEIKIVDKNKLIVVSEKNDPGKGFEITPLEVKAMGPNQSAEIYKEMIEVALINFPNEKLEINVPASEKAVFEKCLKDNPKLKQRLDAIQTVIIPGRVVPTEPARRTSPPTPTRDWPPEPAAPAPQTPAVKTGDEVALDRIHAALTAAANSYNLPPKENYVPLNEMLIEPKQAILDILNGTYPNLFTVDQSADTVKITVKDVNNQKSVESIQALKGILFKLNFKGLTMSDETSSVDGSKPVNTAIGIQLTRTTFDVIQRDCSHRSAPSASL